MSTHGWVAKCILLEDRQYAVEQFVHQVLRHGRNVLEMYIQKFVKSTNKYKNVVN